MSKEKKSKISYFQSNFTSTVSVSLVLLLVGVVAFLAIVANNFNNELKENIGFNVVVSDEASAEEIIELDKVFKTAPYVSRSRFISKEEALQSWQAETGENLVELFGVNPLGAEFEVYVKSEYANVDSLTRIEKGLVTVPFIDEVVMHKDEVGVATRNISNIAIILLAVATVLLFISFALINNTVRLTVYSRRFLIHTMKLVGAKPGFIRKPFIISNMINGAIAAVLAILLLLAIYFSIQEIDSSLLSGINWINSLIVFSGLIGIGAMLCGIAAFFASSKYINLSYDELFKR